MRLHSLGLRHLLLIAIALLPFHMVEQLLYGLDELYELQGQVGSVMTLFPDPDTATVMLVFGVVMAVLFLRARDATSIASVTRRSALSSPHSHSGVTETTSARRVCFLLLR